MPMSVPDYQQQVSPSTPEIPKAQMPSAVPDAFGGDVAGAVAGVGKTITASADQLQEHIMQRLQQNMEMDVYNGEMGLRDQANKMLNSTDMITIKDKNGNPVDVPQGVLNRKGSLADGSYAEFKSSFDTAASAYQNQYKTASQKRLASFLSQRLQGYYSEQASKHEAVQSNLAFQQSNVTSQQSNIQLAGGTTDPSMISSLMDSNERLATVAAEHDGFDPKVEGKQSIDSTKGQVLQASLSKALQDSNGDPTSAMNLLTKLGDKVSPEKLSEMEKYVDTTSKSIKGATELAQTQGMVNNRIDMLTGLANQTINADNLPQVIGTTATKDPKLAEAIQTVVENKYNFQPNFKDKEAGSLQKILQGMVTSGNQKQLTDTLTSMLTTNGKDLTPDTLAVAVQAAVNMNKALPCIDGDSVPVAAEQNKTNAGLKALMAWDKNVGANDSSLYKSYFKDVGNKTDPTAAVANAQKNWILKNYPETAAMDDPPNMIVDKDSPIKLIFPRSTSVTANRVYNPKSGALENNSLIDTRKKEQ